MASAVSAASSAATATTYVWTASIIQRRSNASASTPAGRASSIIGRVMAVCTNGTIVSAFGSLTNNHCAPTICPHMPVEANTTPNHNQKNARCRSGANGDDLGAARCGAGALDEVLSLCAGSTNTTVRRRSSPVTVQVPSNRLGQSGAFMSSTRGLS